MTQEEILKKGAPIEPNCFETDREEQWYKVGLYEGATASPWHSVADGNIPKVDTDYLFAYDGVIDKGYMREDRSLSLDSEFAPLLDIDDVDYWMEIPELPTE